MKAVLVRQMIPRRWLPAAAAVAWLALAPLAPAWGIDQPADERPSYWIGYTVQRTDLQGYYRNRSTGRAFAVRGDGSGATELAPELVSKPHQFTQFGGWGSSPDGRMATLYQIWESPENGAWEDEHGRWRFSAEHHQRDLILLDMETKKTTNLTAVERVSFYNDGLGPWPDKPGLFRFSAMIDGELRPYQMDRDGKNKKPLPAGPGFIYGMSPSPDGKRVCYHRNYRLYLAEGDCSHAQPVEDDHPFHFMPAWSPTGEWLAYLSGEHYNCHPYLIRPDGRGLRKLADRGDYRGVFQPIDNGGTGHSERSDPPAWSPDGKWLYYTAKVGEAVELMRASPNDGKIEQLTQSKPGVSNYLPQVSPDSKWVVFGSTRTGVRQLHVARADGSEVYQLTKVEPGWGAFHPDWRPQMSEEEQAITKLRLRLLIDRVLEAHGGEDKLNQLQFTMTVKPDNGTTEQYFVQPPDHFRAEYQQQGEATKRIWFLLPHGRQWWRKHPNGNAEPVFRTGAELPMEHWLDYVKFFGPRRVLRLKDANHRVAPLDEVKIDGRAAVGVEVTAQSTPLLLRMYFDKETRLLVKLGDTYYSDYEKFDGIPIARKEKHPHAGTGAWEAEITGFRVVDEFDAKLFEQP